MAYNNYFPAGYQPMQAYSQIQQPIMQQPQPAQPMTDLKWVQGEAGAKSYMVAPNTSVTLWDSESQTIYIKAANATGLPTMTVLDYTIRDNAPQTKPTLAESNFATKEDVSLLKEQIDALKAKFEVTEGKEKK